jgi:hypothetical protein
MVDSQRTTLLCTPATVGILKERGHSLAEIARMLKAAPTTVRRYWLEWKTASEDSRALARKGVRIP